MYEVTVKVKLRINTSNPKESENWLKNYFQSLYWGSDLSYDVYPPLTTFDVVKVRELDYIPKAAWSLIQHYNGDRKQAAKHIKEVIAGLKLRDYTVYSDELGHDITSEDIVWALKTL